MELREAKALALELMQRHQLLEAGWRVEWSKRMTRGFGHCFQQLKLIKLSIPLTEINSVEHVRDTILHEIAHALVGAGHGHDWLWKAKCRQIGAKPERTYSEKDGYKVIPKKRRASQQNRVRHVWYGLCPAGHDFLRIQASKPRRSACGKCSRVFEERNVIRWRRGATAITMPAAAKEPR